MHNSASANKRTNERTKKMTTTTGMTTGMMTVLWFHDAVDEDEFEQENPRVMTNDDDNDDDDGYCCENCRKMDLQQQWEERQEFMQQHSFCFFFLG